MTITLVSAAVVLLVFYLVMLAKWECVKRPFFLLVGSLGVLLGIFSGLFAGWATAKWASVLIAILSTIGTLVAFVGAFIACYGAKLPTEGAASEDKAAAPEGKAGKK